METHRSLTFTSPYIQAVTPAWVTSRPVIGTDSGGELGAAETSLCSPIALLTAAPLAAAVPSVVAPLTADAPSSRRISSDTVSSDALRPSDHQWGRPGMGIRAVQTPRLFLMPSPNPLARRARGPSSYPAPSPMQHLSLIHI